jgi:MYXO-CTERM domain-containing protein
MKSSAALLAIAITVGAASAGTITTYFDRPSYEADAVAGQIVEDFTDTFHFPISTGILNSETNLPDIGLFPGMIEVGATYSTEIGQGNFFNIDAGGGYTGGFLDGFEPSDREVKVAFHLEDPNVPRNVNAFGFDIGSLGAADFDVKITFADGSQQDFNFAYPDDPSFFGFQSDAQDIASVVIGNNGGFFAFDFDNFTYDRVPTPGAAALLGLGGLVAARRRRI